MLRRTYWRTTIVTFSMLFLLTFSHFSAATEPVSKELRLIAGSWSQHIGGGKYKKDGQKIPYNETHHSLGVSFRETQGNKRTSHNLFTFVNSYDKRAVSWLYSSSKCTSWVCYGWAGGLATGYQEQFWYLTPVGGLTASIDVGPVGINTMFIPFANVMTVQLDLSAGVFGVR